MVRREGLEPGLHARPNRVGALLDVARHRPADPDRADVCRCHPTGGDRVPESWLARFRQTRGLFAYSIVSLSLTCLTRPRRPVRGFSAALRGRAAAAIRPSSSACRRRCSLTRFSCSPRRSPSSSPARSSGCCRPRRRESDAGRVSRRHCRGGRCCRGCIASTRSLAFGLLFVVVQPIAAGSAQAAGRVKTVDARALAVAAASRAACLDVRGFWGTLGGPQMVDGLPVHADGPAARGLGLFSIASADSSRTRRSI